MQPRWSLAFMSQRLLISISFPCLVHQGLDGVILAYDPSQPQHEAELEKLYTTFAQPSRLTTSQCMTLAINLSSGIGSTGARPPNPAWTIMLSLQDFCWQVL